MSEIKARDLCVDFPIYNASGRSMKNAVLRATTGGRIARSSKNATCVRSLDQISFDICEGDRVGLLGHNGSGKTTLLRVLSGVYAPTGGSLDVGGRVASLLDLSLGMDPEATGYENILMRGIVMGMTPKMMESKIDEIADFTDLGEYLEMPLRTYSSGMQMRLAFAVSTCVDAEILLMDEWISVGDADFQEKAAKRLNDLIKTTPILVIATHSPELVKKVCNRKIELCHGQMILDERLASIQSKYE